MVIILDGKTLSKRILNTLANEVKELKQKGITPKISLVLVGEDPSSKSYVKLKSKRAKAIGIQSEVHELPENVSELELIDLIRELNKDESVHGIVIQLPLPIHINEKRVICEIDPRKDVDGLHPLNIGKLMIGEDCLASPAAKGIIALLDEYKIVIKNKHVVILGATELTGKPLAAMLLNRGADTTICQSTSNKIEKHSKNADILVVDIGKPKAIKGFMIKSGAAIIDCGFNYVENKLVGDVDFESVKQIASAITPVPGGVGPMIIAMLLSNLIKAVKMSL